MISTAESRAKYNKLNSEIQAKSDLICDLLMDGVNHSNPTLYQTHVSELDKMRSERDSLMRAL
jgi:gamma-glutamyl-gamma-aminobutyrate hydrolase PuuD